MSGEPVEPKRHTGIFLLAYLLTGGAILYACTSDSDEDKHAASPTTPTAPPAHQTMPGDGTYNMGGIDGKDWGIWQSSGGTGCEWSIRAVSRYTTAEVLDSGQAARVNIQPLPDSSMFTGESHGFHVVFMTNGCGSWRWVE